MSDVNVRLLRESLEKKKEVLERIIVRNEQQSRIFKDEKSTPDDLQENLDAKDKLIERVLKLDEGFEGVFALAKDEIEADKETYADEIMKMKALIAEITELSARVEAQEQRNRELAKTRFSEIKSKIKYKNQGSAAVNEYYRNMTRTGVVPPHFMDKKE